MDGNKKQYGLLLPKKTSAAIAPVVRKPTVFDSDSDEESSSVDWMSKSVKKETYGSGKSRQTKFDIEKVLKEDPTAYQYDEVYDDMKKKDEAIEAKKNDKKPKYMSLLMKQAERRKREDERRKERQIQKEREAEGDEFADKEVFITSSYKKKLEEMKKMDEEDKRMERLEEIGDVTKQCDLNGFYRHLYETMMEPHKKPVLKLSATDSKESDNALVVADSSAKFRGFDKNKIRSIRKRASSSDDESNVSAETDRTAPNKKRPSNNEDGYEKPQTEASHVESIPPETSSVECESENGKTAIKSEPLDKIENEDRDDVDDENETEESEGKLEDKRSIKKSTPKKKIDIWIKRTVGEVFDAAVLRYQERKANRIVAC